MKDGVGKTLRKYGITVIIAGLMAFAVIRLYGLADAADAAERYKILSNAFTIPGVLLLGLGTLVWLSNQGSFTGLSYVVSYAVNMLMPGSQNKGERYADYLERRNKKGPTKGFGFLFVTGGAFTAVAVLFIVLFYNAQ